MYWTDLKTAEIQRANLDGSQVETIVPGLGISNAESRGIAVDGGAGKIYWTGAGVRRANLDGSQLETLGSIRGDDIALYVVRGRMYLAEWSDGVQRANLDGSQVRILVGDRDTNATAIGLDPSRGKIYWGHWARDSIHWANLDGSQVEIIVSGLRSVHDFDIDESGGKLYWGGGDGIQRANLDGSQVETLFTVNTNGIALDLGAGKIYWTAWTSDRIQRANLDGSQVETLVTGLDWPTDIALGP